VDSPCPTGTCVTVLILELPEAEALPEAGAGGAEELPEAAEG
jgi:hypothetical protein